MSTQYSAVSTEEVEINLNGEDTTVAKIDNYVPSPKRSSMYLLGLSAGLLIAIISSALLVKVWLFSRPSASTIGWMNNYTRLGSESVIRLLDVNGDGADDILLGIAQPSETKPFIIPQTAPYCTKYKHGCLGALLALDGKSGSLLWNISTYNEVFEINCGNIDINKDGQTDCLGAGRRGSFMAFDYRKGELLWNPQTGKEKYIEYDWNIYNPLVINDLTGDEVKEVILSHGGDPDFPSENTTRYPGRLILLDGSSGKILGKHINMPDGKETYNSPVLHADKNGTQYVLVGTGGESVAGSLFIIRLEDLLHVILSNRPPGQKVVPLNGLRMFENNFFELYRAQSKGVMVPVVLADVTNDNTPDIILSSFDGSLAAYDGNSFQRIWMYTNKAAESYTTPAVGHFDSDEYVDFMMHWNYGIWPDYNRSEVVVHSGKDGGVLWTFSTSQMGMSSDLVIQSYTTRNDYFVFRVQGLPSGVTSSHSAMHGVDPQRKLTGTEVENMKENQCERKDLSEFTSQIYVVDWRRKSEPILIYKQEPNKYYYYQHTDSSERNASRKCVVMEQSARTTGALGDTNNDGALDIAISFDFQANLKDEKGSYTNTEVQLVVMTIDIEKAIDIPKSQMHWKPSNDQVWKEYMGHKSLSKFHGLK